MIDSDYRGVDDNVHLLSVLGRPVVSDLVDWLLTERSRKHEKVTAHWWTESFWYLQIIDERNRTDDPHGISAVRLSFTVDVLADVVFWSNDQHHALKGFTKGGNCAVRSQRWVRKLRAKFPGVTLAKSGLESCQVYDYRPARKKSAAVS